jgi:hypothetical protein
LAVQEHDSVKQLLLELAALEMSDGYGMRSCNISMQI